MRSKLRNSWWKTLLGCGAAGGIACLAGKALAGVSCKLGIPADARQMVLVVLPSWDAVDGTLQCYERAGAGVPWQRVHPSTAVVVGSAGLAWGRGVHQSPVDGAPVKKEGDHRAPAGVFRLSGVFGYAADGASAGVRLPYIHLTATTEGVDDVGSKFYNRIVDRAQIAHPDWRTSEKMRRPDELYRWGVVVDHNTGPGAIPGAGSCIFIHLWRGPSQGTDGCTAMASAPLGELIRWLRPEAAPILVQLPRAVYEEARSGGELPIH